MLAPRSELHRPVLNVLVSMSRFWLRICLVPVALISADEPPDVLPPVIEWHGASESLIVAADHPWATPAEVTGLTTTPAYAETISWLERLSAESPSISMQEFGLTASGRPLYLVVASTASEHSPEALRQSGRPTLLVQAGIHAGEIRSEHEHE